jgi:predicted RNase H-like HicB family nuclease
MITDYIREAMASAVYEYVVETDEMASVFGSIPDLPGVWCDEPTYPDCQRELQSTLEGWLILGLRLGHQLPVIGNIDLNRQSLEVA